MQKYYSAHKYASKCDAHYNLLFVRRVTLDMQLPSCEEMNKANCKWHISDIHINSPSQVGDMKYLLFIKYLRYTTLAINLWLLLKMTIFRTSSQDASLHYMKNNIHNIYKLIFLYIRVIIIFIVI